MEYVYAKSFEKKWYATTPLPALITTQGRCLNPAYAKADQKKTNWSAFCGECYEVMTLLLLIYMMCYMSIPAGKHRSLAPHCSHVSQWRTTKTVATQSVPACSRNLHLPTHFVRRDNQPYYFRILPSLSMPLSRTYRHRNSVGH